MISTEFFTIQNTSSPVQHRLFVFGALATPHSSGFFGQPSPYPLAVPNYTACVPQILEWQRSFLERHKRMPLIAWVSESQLRVQAQPAALQSRGIDFETLLWVPQVPQLFQAVSALTKQKYFDILVIEASLPPYKLSKLKLVLKVWLRSSLNSQSTPAAFVLLHNLNVGNIDALSTETSCQKPWRNTRRAHSWNS